MDIITIAICGVICGADSWVDIELFGKSKAGWLKGFLELPNGIPSHDTFGRVFAHLDAQQFRDCFLQWVQALSAVTRGQVIAIDGKTLRRSHDKSLGKSAIHMVSAWASENRLVLGQTKVAEKSNEITAIPELLALLDVSGCIVTIDAMGCQKAIARLIIEESGDYVLALKEDQGQLYQEVQELFEDAGLVAMEGDFHETVNKGHGRLEHRQCWSIAEQECLSYLNPRGDWPGLRSVAKVTGERRIGEGDLLVFPLIPITGNVKGWRSNEIATFATDIYAQLDAGGALQADALRSYENGVLPATSSNLPEGVHPAVNILKLGPTAVAAVPWEHINRHQT